MQTLVALFRRATQTGILMAATLGMAIDPPAPPRPPPLKLPVTTQYVTVAEARELLKAGRLGGIVDVRTPEEAAGNRHLPRARFVNLFVSNFDESILRLELDRSRPCLVYCALGGRAARAALRMDALGFKDLLVLQGGFEAWHRQGGELEE